MAHQINWKIADDVGEGGEVEQMFRDAVERAWSPLAIAMAPEIHGVDVKMFAQCAGDPIPVAGMIQAAVDQDESWLAFLSPVPELQFESMGVVVVRDGFQFIYCRLAGRLGTEFRKVRGEDTQPRT